MSQISPDKIEIQKAPMVFRETQKELEKLAKAMDCPVVSYFKPPSGNIWPQDLYGFLEVLKKIGKTDQLVLYIRSNAGQGMVSLRMVNLLRSFAKKVILLAPSECASAATMLALGCDEIHMGPMSSLSPVDSSLTHPLSPVDRLGNSVSVSLNEIWRVLRLWKEVDVKESLAQIGITKDGKLTDISKENVNSSESSENPYKHLYEYIHPLVFGAVDRHSSLSVRICEEILSYHMTDKQKIQKITHELNYNYPAHGYPITFLDAKRIGLPVKELSDKVSKILNNLQLLYSELTEEKITDYDNSMYHDHTIYSMVETSDLQILYQQDYDKFYREAEKRYITLNDKSGWHRVVPDLKSKDQYKIKRIHF